MHRVSIIYQRKVQLCITDIANTSERINTWRSSASFSKSRNEEH